VIGREEQKKSIQEKTFSEKSPYTQKVAEKYITTYMKKMLTK
jgi:hypothetical protein